ncbi:MAG: hypothetical protein WCX22_08780 [Methanoregula sp.]|jgi:transcription elongation factor Elf1
MTQHSGKQEIPGTRTGYVIRFICPQCAAENHIISKTPKDHYKESRDANCSKCRTRSRVLTPRMIQGSGYMPVMAPNAYRTR